MKRKSKYIKKIIGVLICCIALESVSVQASNKIVAKVAYQKFFEQKYSGENSKAYKLIDIDRNGIPEMIVSTGYSQCVFTYLPKAKKVKKVASGIFGTGPWVNNKKHRFIIEEHNSGMNKYKIYRLSGSKAKKVGIYLAEKVYDDSGNEWVYKINGKKYSQSKWESKRKKAFQGYRQLLWKY